MSENQRLYLLWKPYSCSVEWAQTHLTSGWCKSGFPVCGGSDLYLREQEMLSRDPGFGAGVS